MLDSETRRRIDTARDILVGKVPDPKSQVEQITIALIYKFMDDMDAESEEMGGKRSFFAGEHEKYGWAKLMAPNMGGYDVINLYSEAIQRFDFNPGIPQLFRDIFKNAYLPYRDPETLKSFLKVIDDFEYDHSEKLGDAFEYLLSILGSQGEAGQFRTPRHIIDFMVAAIDPKKNDVIIDPACGTAGFLISSYKHIVKQNSSNYDPEKDTLIADAKDISELIPGSNGRYKGDKLTPDERTRLANNIKGYDISPDMVRLSLVNMYLHGFTDPHIYEYDTLTSEDRWNEFGDVIMANPPFMSPKGGIKPHKRFSVQSNRSEVLFVDYIAEHLAPNGRAAVIVPEGIIFQSGNAYKALRKMLVENYLFCVVSLPSGVFNPYSGVKTSILLMDKTLTKRTDKILFVKIENDGFDLGAQRRRIQGSDLPESLNHIKAYNQSVRAGQEFNAVGIPNLLLVTKEQIGTNGDYNMSMERYRTEEIPQTQWEMVELGDERFFSIYSGGTPATDQSEYWGGEYNWVTLVDLPQKNYISLIRSTERKITELGLKNSSAVLLPIHSVIVSSRATIGRVGINEVETATNQGFRNIVIRDKARTDYCFVAYMVKQLENKMNELGSGGTFKEISRSNFSLLRIPLPPLSVQQEIVAEIESYQKIIDGARQVVENYKPQIKVDPEWPVKPLGEVITLQRGYDLPKTQFVNGKVPVVGSNGIIGYHNVAKEKGPGVVTGRSGTIGKVHFIDYEYYWPHNTALFVKEFNGNDRKYIRFLLESIDLKSLGENVAAVPSLDRKNAHRILISLPPLESQQEIVAKIEKEQQLVNANKELIQIYKQKIKDKIASIWET